MNSKKICFILCVNSELYANEAVHYLNHLYVPEGYEVDLLEVRDAISMTSGYQEAMESSDAKYKVYMHQDVFIVNPWFIYDVISIFESDNKIGMIGMFGYTNISPDGVMWHGKNLEKFPKDRIEKAFNGFGKYRYSFCEDGIYSAAEIDGFMMVTSCDVEWNTEELKEWHFYDAYHSLDVWKAGYKVVVPKQNIPWCLHDDSKILKMYGYDEYRQLFVKKYQEFLGMNVDELENRFIHE